jgi:hypothetical protein
LLREIIGKAPEHSPLTPFTTTMTNKYRRVNGALSKAANSTVFSFVDDKFIAILHHE